MQSVAEEQHQKHNEQSTPQTACNEADSHKESTQNRTASSSSKAEFVQVAEKDDKQPILTHDFTVGSTSTEVRFSESTSSSGFGRLAIAKRYLLLVMVFLGFFILAGIRCNLGVAFFEMSRRWQLASNPEVSANETMPFDRSIQTISLVYTASLWGNFLVLLPSGYLAVRFSATKIFGFSIAISALLNMLLPLSTNFHHVAAIVIRVLQGVAESALYPACFGIWSRWSPPLERSRLLTLSVSGSYFGVVVGIAFSRCLTQMVGWQTPFYVYGVVGVLWWLLWLLVCYESPAQHPTITQQERTYIEKSLDVKRQSSDTPIKLPWKALLFSKAVATINVAAFASAWSTDSAVLSVVKYLFDDFNIFSEDGMLSGYPRVLAMGFMIPIGGFVADYLQIRGLSTLLVRRIFNSSGLGLQAVLLMAWAFSPTPIVAVVLADLSMAFNGLAFSGYFANHLDIAPRYAAFLVALSKFVEQLSVVVSSILVNFLRNIGVSWVILLVVPCCSQLAAVLIYFFAAAGVKQPWAQTAGVGQVAYNNRSHDAQSEANDTQRLCESGQDEPKKIEIEIQANP